VRNDNRQAQCITIDSSKRAEVVAWASALHVSEEELIDAIAKVGNAAREVIAYVLQNSRGVTLASRSGNPNGLDIRSQ
jgi:hypothetical protein